VRAAPPSETPARQVPLDVHLANGWRAISVSLNGSPLALVEFVSDSRGTAYARVDLDKGVLLDREVVDISPEDRDRLVGELRGHAREHAHRSRSPAR